MILLAILMWVQSLLLDTSSIVKYEWEYYYKTERYCSQMEKRWIYDSWCDINYLDTIQWYEEAFEKTEEEFNQMMEDSFTP